MPTLTRRILGVIAGFIVTVLLVMLTTALAAGVALESIDAAPTSAYLALNLLGGLLSALAGGYVAARLAQGAEKMQGLVLGGLILLFGLFSALAPQEGQPGWYGFAVPLFGAVGAYLGALLRLRSAY